MCTRILWSSAGSPGQGHVLVGRGMDWYEDAKTVLAVRPRSAERESRPGDPGSFSWTSKYGSVVSLMYGKLVADGMNELGLQASGLYLAESDYGERDPERPPIDLYIVIQYMLDNFSTVAEAVAWLQESRVQIVPLNIGGRPGTGHISLADPTGDSVIIEYLDGNLSLHHGPQYSVMTNSPPYDEQLELERHYAGLGGDAPPCRAGMIRGIVSHELRSIQRSSPQRTIDASRPRSYSACCVTRGFRTGSATSRCRTVRRRAGARSPISPADATTTNRRCHPTWCGSTSTDFRSLRVQSSCSTRKLPIWPVNRAPRSRPHSRSALDPTVRSTSAERGFQLMEAPLEAMHRHSDLCPREESNFRHPL